MTGIKRMMVEEQVKEHKADELSAMFNMLLYKKQRERGLFDNDHTCKRAKAGRESRSKSRERDMGVVPRQAPLKQASTDHTAKGKGLRGKGATGKKGAGRGATKTNGKAAINRPTTLETRGNMASLGLPAETTDHAIDTAIFKMASTPSPGHHQPHTSHHYPAQSTSARHDPSHHAAMATSHGQRSQHYSHGHNHLKYPLTATPGGYTDSAEPAHNNSIQRPIDASVSSGAEGASDGATAPAANGPITSTRLPLSQRRKPHGKLNMTLDLSVTTPNTLRNVHSWRVKNAAALGHGRGGTHVLRGGGGGGEAWGSGAAPRSGSAAETNADAVSVGGSSHGGVAASSGVRPRIAPISREVSREGCTSRLPVTSPARSRASCSPGGSLGSYSIDAATGKKANRPSTLQYLMTGLERVRKHLPGVLDLHHHLKDHDGPVAGQAETSFVAGDREAELKSETDSEWMRAPKATPEDSVIDSYNSPSPDTETVSPTGVGLRRASGRLDSIQEASDLQESASMLAQDLQRNESSHSPAAQSETSSDREKATNKGGSEQISEYRKQSHISGILKYTDMSMRRKSPDYQPTVSIEAPSPCSDDSHVFLDSPTKCEHTLLGDEKEVIHTIRVQLMQDDDPPSYESLTKSSHSSLGMDYGPNTVEHNLNTDSNSSLCQSRFHSSPIAKRIMGKSTSKQMTPLASLLAQHVALSQSGSEPLTVGRIEPQGSQSAKRRTPVHPASISFSNLPTYRAGDASCHKCGLSPGSPSYDERHVRFCHTGSHALDVFFSPDDDEDDSPESPFWSTHFPPSPSQPLHDDWRSKNTDPSRYVEHGYLGVPSVELSDTTKRREQGYNFPKVGADTPNISMRSNAFTAREAFRKSWPLNLAYQQKDLGNTNQPHEYQQQSPKSYNKNINRVQGSWLHNNTREQYTRSASPLYTSESSTKSIATHCGCHQAYTTTHHCSNQPPSDFASPATAAVANSVCSNTPVPLATDKTPLGAPLKSSPTCSHATPAGSRPVYQSIPDTSLRLEPVGGSCESLLAWGAYTAVAGGRGVGGDVGGSEGGVVEELQRVQGDGATEEKAHIGSRQSASGSSSHSQEQAQKLVGELVSPLRHAASDTSLHFSSDMRTWTDSDPDTKKIGNAPPAMSAHCDALGELGVSSADDATKSEFPWEQNQKGQKFKLGSGGAVGKMEAAEYATDAVSEKRGLQGDSDNIGCDRYQSGCPSFILLGDGIPKTGQKQNTDRDLPQSLPSTPEKATLNLLLSWL